MRHRLANARRMLRRRRGVRHVAERILVSSTGVIGVPLPIEKIERGLVGIAADLVDDPLVGAEGIMTTDSHPKALSLNVGDVIITWVAKGSGMIEPNMATMLSYIMTDAAIATAELDRLLRDVVDVSFNMLSVDTDTSTSDTCVILANGLAGRVDPDAFRKALMTGSLRMTEMLARDGEGATKLLRATFAGRRSAEARRSRSHVNSPLGEDDGHGADPNVGRLLWRSASAFDWRDSTGDRRIRGSTDRRSARRRAYDVR